ncbi:hypothetical protein [Streptomyces rhizosphaericus]|uniref:hypothetical protein n=1 Tax=Streptomyces rhizosphaericus TaxID=114699 RepID=UPI001ABFC615|nr:hypothetical protein [Streptomyces rhizosphaericus]
MRDSNRVLHDPKRCLWGRFGVGDSIARRVQRGKLPGIDLMLPGALAWSIRPYELGDEPVDLDDDHISFKMLLRQYAVLHSSVDPIAVYAGGDGNGVRGEAT